MSFAHGSVRALLPINVSKPLCCEQELKRTSKCFFGQTLDADSKRCFRLRPSYRKTIFSKTQ